LSVTTTAGATSVQVLANIANAINAEGSLAGFDTSAFVQDDLPVTNGTIMGLVSMDGGLLGQPIPAVSWLGLAPLVGALLGAARLRTRSL